MLTTETFQKLLKEVGENSVIFISKLNPDGTTSQFINYRMLRPEIVVSLLEQAKFKILHEIYNTSTSNKDGL